MHFCNLFYQKQKNKNCVVQRTLDYKLDSSVARWKFVWVIVLSKIHLFSANECMPDELPFWSKSELKLAQHKGNFKTAQFRSPELHLLYVFLVQDYNRSGNRRFWVTSMMWCSVQKNSYFYGFFLLKRWLKSVLVPLQNKNQLTI